MYVIAHITLLYYNNLRYLTLLLCVTNLVFTFIWLSSLTTNYPRLVIGHALNLHRTIITMINITLNAAILRKLLSQITIPVVITVELGDNQSVTTKLRSLQVKAHKSNDGAVDQLHLIVK